MMNEAVIVSICRTAIGKAPRGTLRNTHAMDLAGLVTKEAIARVPQLDPAEIDEVVFSSALPESETGFDIGRVAARMAGLPDSVPGWQVSVFCASGSLAIAAAADRIKTGFADIVVAGGVDSMSLVQQGGQRNAFSPRFIRDFRYEFLNNGVQAENVAERFNVTREEQDWLGYTSNQRAAAAIRDGKFKEQILPINVVERFVGPDDTMQEKITVFDTDEGVRPETTMESLAKLKPYAKAGGTVTAGNSSQMSDGAGAVVLMSAKKAAALGVKPMGIVHGFSLVGCEAEIFGISPALAVPKLMKQTNFNLQDVQLHEINEAFASQAYYCVRELGLDWNNVNPNGGAIAIGHPLAGTGIMLTAKLLYELKRRNQRWGVVSLCIGQGMGAATLIERVD
jgi:acetyl-CoA acyltransferase